MTDGDGDGDALPPEDPTQVGEDARHGAAAGVALASLAGVDEVGRGCLFGPVFAAACCLDAAALPILAAAGVQDSKALTSTHRQRLLPVIRRLAVDLGLGQASAREIHQRGIRAATELAMMRALQRLATTPQLVLVDGNLRLRPWCNRQRTVVHGDQRCLTIACASIVAKQARDGLLLRLDRRFPGYGLASHKGYGTPQHRAALRRLGPTPLHRLSFLGKIPGTAAAVAAMPLHAHGARPGSPAQTPG
ncbi:MAG: ribonuclease HII [Synechococcus sp. SB0662_bin_45]|uniref:Ribonuclease HII n=1 Tax=Synechococcus sp. SB0676_bin_10 TaxID=2604869 RepID=A0A6B1FBF4_9SYNE|nr:ribonuclease HII [Cyanobacteria bacterium MAG IRC3_bin_20]MDE0648444.1 ribonuclease HII [Cyanobacteria bacterium MAG IRC4_bin_6]MXW11700.1 ribonuclease HII [Synechococcus sp. SB0668_bin_13]MXX09471.1 ribonuclease HII [Synechococcus sp. SB0667_bin_8]MXY19635.1 ribonuclease HII [Synechococcus sp. SB0664_bin_36]MYE21464.1 ribonuclease HII [Synechococcus sp. SB0662_bin_45]MYF20593.1 ribonuclease HII [Synechococcus sp. SB0677_bin_5]MYG38263.1 ribonuclease HII [Synechococcus sp. SB0676_bin_10]